MDGRPIRDRFAPTRGRLGLVTVVGLLAAAAAVFLPGLLSRGGGTRASGARSPGAESPGAGPRPTAARPAATHGEIVVQRTRMTVVSTISASHRTHQALMLTSITQSTAGGQAQRGLVIDSLARPGFEETYAGNALAIYDPRDDTIYEATQAGLQAAQQREATRRAAKGTGGSGTRGSGTGGSGTGGSRATVGTTRATKMQLVSSTPGPSDAPDGRSAFRLDLREHLYRLAGRTRIDGRQALELVATRQGRRTQPGPDAEPLLGTVYVNPATYAPIRQVIDARLTPGIEIVSTQDWLQYEILPATPANERLLSLRARHPGARVVHGAGGYLRVQAAATRR